METQKANLRERPISMFDSPERLLFLAIQGLRAQTGVELQEEDVSAISELAWEIVKFREAELPETEKLRFTQTSAS